MDWDAIGALAELVGAVGVIASLVYLASQIRQNTNAMRGTAHESSVARNTSWTIAIGSSAQVAALLTKGHSDYHSLSSEERYQYTHMLTAMFLGAEATFHQYKRGNLEREIWERSLASVHVYAAFPGVRTFWKATRAIYTPEFQSIVDAEVGRVRSGSTTPAA